MPDSREQRSNRSEVQLCSGKVGPNLRSAAALVSRSAISLGGEDCVLPFALCCVCVCVCVVVYLMLVYFCLCAFALFVDCWCVC